MTISDKNTILQMRRNGKSYTQIADALNMPKNTIKTVCSRNKAVLTQCSSSNTCEQCGKEIKQRSNAKKKRFCSDSCRLAWWNTNREQVQKKNAHTIICALCGTQFESYDVGRKYCCHACYISDRFGKGSNRHEPRAV